MTRLANLARHHAIALTALFISLGGTSYAALRIPDASVGTRQLRDGAVTANKLNAGSIAGYVRAWAQIDRNGRVIASRPRARIIVWRTGAFAPGGTVRWSNGFPPSCFAEATTATLGPNPSYASAIAGGVSGRSGADTAVLLSAPMQPVNVAIICPQP